MFLALLSALALAGPLEDCDAAYDDSSSVARRLSTRCYYTAARRGVPRAQVLERLAHIDDPWAELVRAYLASDHDDPDTSSLYHQVIARFDAAHEPLGQVYSRIGLSTWLGYQDRGDEALALLREAEEFSHDTDDPWLPSTLTVQRARQLVSAGRYQRALDFIQPIEGTVFPDGPHQLKLVWLHVASAANHDLGHYARALDLDLRMVELTREAGDHYVAATSLVSALSLLSNSPTLRAQLGEEREDDMLRQALEEARLGDNPFAEAGAWLQRGVLRRDADALDHAISAYRDMGELPWQPDTLAKRALITPDPQRAIAQAREALALSLSVPDNETAVIQCRLVLAWLLWREHDVAAAREQNARLVDDIEARLDRQWDPESRAWVRDQWSLPGFMLAEGLAFQDQPDLPGAFDSLERARGRSLRADLVGRALPATAEETTLRTRYREQLDAVAQAQGALLEDHPGPEAQDQLRDAESAASLTRAALAHLASSDGGEGAVSMGEVQDALAPNQALVLFQLAHADTALTWAWPQAHTRPWALVLTHEGARAVALEDLDYAGITGAFLDLVPSRDGSERLAGRRLHDALLAPVQAALPEGIEALVVVPDAGLGRLPFEALAGDLRASLVPSATIWFALHKRQTPPSGVVLALGDPPPSDPALAPLPRARAEARLAATAGVGDSRALLGDDASEGALLEQDWSEPAILHVAAHAVVDVEHPERSALVLAPEGGDGRVQAREIAGLDLQGQVVVLSACGSADGRELRGEGTLGLARAFFRAGARTVVATRWPVRDDEAERFFASFYDQPGATVGEAVAAAQADLRVAGAPTEAWAGVVIMGDAEARPLPAPHRLGAKVWGLIGGVWGGAVALWWGLRRRRIERASNKD